MNDSYISMTPRLFSELLRSQAALIVEFGAEWSGSCHIMAPILNDWQGRIKIVRLDIERNRPLTERYGIRKKPTFLLIKDGHIIERIVGSVPRHVFERKVSDLLNTH
jgi:thioredoxin 1